MGSGVSAPYTKPRPMYAGTDGEGVARVPGSKVCHTGEGINPMLENPRSYSFGGGQARYRPEAFDSAWEFEYHLINLVLSFAPIEEFVAPIFEIAPWIGRTLSGLRKVEEGGGAATQIGLKAYREKGLAAQEMVRGAQNTSHITVPGGTNYRIPDRFNLDWGHMGEIKNVKSLSKTRQIKDMMKIANELGLVFYLYVGKATKLSGRSRTRSAKVRSSCSA